MLTLKTNFDQMATAYRELSTGVDKVAKLKDLKVLLNSVERMRAPLFEQQEKLRAEEDKFSTFAQEHKGEDQAALLRDERNKTNDVIERLQKEAIIEVELSKEAVETLIGTLENIEIGKVNGQSLDTMLALETFVSDLNNAE